MTIVAAGINNTAVMHSYRPHIVRRVGGRRIDVVPGVARVVADRQPAVGAHVNVIRLVRIKADAVTRRLLGAAAKAQKLAGGFAVAGFVPRRQLPESSQGERSG